MNRLTLTGLFVTCLVTAQVLSSKLLVLTLPIIGIVSMPGGTVAYAGTFFASDVMGELYGKSDARRMVNIGFAMNFVLLALVYITIQWPAAQGSIDTEAFAMVLGSSANIIAGSLAAYLISQHWDVFVFHTLRKREGRLWVRNIASTGSSQLVDTVVFTLTAFYLAPTVFGVGAALPMSVLLSVIVGQYVAKLAIAALDTPLVYAAVRRV